MIAAAALLLAALLPLVQHTPQEVGFVVKVDGRWSVVRDGTPLPKVERSTPLFEGDMLQREQPGGDSRMIIALYTGDVQTLVATTTLPVQTPTNSWTRIGKSIRQRFAEGFVSASVRGGLDVADAVVVRRDNGVDLRGVFPERQPRSYQVVARRILSGRMSADPAGRARVTTGSAAIAFPALPAGTYQLDISGVGAGETGIAWIAVVPPKAFPSIDKTFHRLTRSTGTPAADETAARRALGRAYFLGLDEQAPGR